MEAVLKKPLLLNPLNRTDTSHNIVELSSRRATKAQALMAYAHAKTDAERYRAMNALVLARLAERDG